VVILSAIVGLKFVLQQTPLDVIVAPPFQLTLPPPVAEIDVISDKGKVVSSGSEGVFPIRSCW